MKVFVFVFIMYFEGKHKKRRIIFSYIYKKNYNDLRQIIKWSKTYLGVTLWRSIAAKKCNLKVCVKVYAKVCQLITFKLKEHY